MSATQVFNISEFTYGNWLTHGSQVENDQAKACIRAALDVGISTFDTADAYANTKAETVLGEAPDLVGGQGVGRFRKQAKPTGRRDAYLSHRMVEPGEPVR